MDKSAQNCERIPTTIAISRAKQKEVAFDAGTFGKFEPFKLVGHRMRVEGSGKKPEERKHQEITRPQRSGARCCYHNLFWSGVVKVMHRRT